MTADVFDERVVVDETRSFYGTPWPQGNAADWRVVTVCRAWGDQLVYLRARKLGVWTSAFVRQSDPFGCFQVARGRIRAAYAFGESLCRYGQKVVAQRRCHRLRETGCALCSFFLFIGIELVEWLWASEWQQRNCSREHDGAVVDIHITTALTQLNDAAQNDSTSLINAAFWGFTQSQNCPRKMVPNTDGLSVGTARGQGSELRTTRSS